MLFSCSKRTCGKHFQNNLDFYHHLPFPWCLQEADSSWALGMLRPLASYCCSALMACLHPLLTSLLGCKLFQAEAAWEEVSPLQQAAKEHLLPHGGPLRHYLLPSHCPGAWAGSVLGTHWYMGHIWLHCPLACDRRYKVLQGCPEAFVGWRWVVGVRVANVHLGPATRDSSLRRSQCMKTLFYS